MRCVNKSIKNWRDNFIVSGGRKLSFYGVVISLLIGNGGRNGFRNLGICFLKRGFGFKNSSGSNRRVGFLYYKWFR